MKNKVRAMNKTWRRSIFWSFIFVFAILGPLLVIYTAGYRYNLASGQIVRTGVLSIVSDPRGVSIYLDDELEKERTSAVIKRLIPGTYSLRLEKNEYHSWSGEVKITSGATTNVNTILLFLNDEPTLLFTKDTVGLTANPNGQLIAYTTIEGGWEEIWLYDLKNQTHKMISQRVEPKTETVLTWSVNGSYLLTFNTSARAEVFDKSGNLIDLSFTLSDLADSAVWHPSNDNVLFFASAEGLEEVNIPGNYSTLINNTDETSISLDASVLNFVDDGSYTELMQLINDEPTLLALLPRSDYTIAIRDGSYLILTDQKNRLILVDIRADIPILLETQASLFDWQEDKNILVYSDGYEVRIYDPGTHANNFITRQSQQIQSLIWHPSISSILLQYQTSIIAFEHYNASDTRKTFTLIDGELQIQDVWISSDGQTLYYYAFENGAYGLYQLELTKSFISL